MVGVSHLDAQSFCTWLTKVEREAGTIGASDVFTGCRLQQSGALSQAYPPGRTGIMYAWGRSWPASSVSGNFPPAMIRMASGGTYDDGYPYTSAVGVFPSGWSRFSDVGGNVREWCQDEVAAVEGNNLHIVRGAAWGLELPEGDSHETLLRLGREDLQPADAQWSNLGFRGGDRPWLGLLICRT